ncbi:unnamed protein product [Closterium sp. NIES-53]
MASLRILAFDHDDRPVQFDTSLYDLQLYLLSDNKDGLSLFDHVSGAGTAPPTTADAQALYDAVVSRYSSPATAALGRLLLPYMFPDLSSFATVEDLVSHLRASDASYCAAVPAEDHFLSLDPTSLTADLLEQHLLAAETSEAAVGAARGSPRPPFFEGCSPSPLAPSYASAAAADVSVPEDVGAASASAKRRSSKGKGGKGNGGGSGGGGGGSWSSGEGSSGGSGGSGTAGGSGGSGGGSGGSGGSGGGGGSGTGGGGTGARRGGSGGGQRQQQQRRSETLSPQQLRQTCRRSHTQHRCFFRLDDAWRAEFGDDVKLPRWADLLRSRIALFDLDFDAILSAMYALSVGAECDCYRCVPPDPGIAAAALGASVSGTLPGTARAEALHTFTLDSGASRCFFRDSTTLTPLPAPVPLRLADPSDGPVEARSSTVLPCLAISSSSLSGLYLPSFATNLVSTAALQDAMVTTTTTGGQRVSICTCTWMGRHLATFTRRPGSSLYTLATKPSQVAASAQVSASGQVAASCSCRLLSHQTLLWHHLLGHPSLPRLRGMHSRLLVSGLPKSLPPLPPSPAPPCLPCVEGRQRAAPHSSSFPPTTAPLQTLHMDVGGEFSSTFLRDFCRGEGILQLFTLPDSPQQNGIAECRIGLVIEVARTSMIHALAPYFLWSFAVHYAAHQLNLWPRVSLPETLPTLRWTGEVCDASVFRVWGSCAFVHDTSADKLSPCAMPCVFFGFVLDTPDWQFYHPTSRRVFPSQDITFDESVPFYRLFPYRSAPPPPPPLFLAPSPSPVAVGSGVARGAATGGVACGGAEPWSAKSEGAERGGIASGGGDPRGAEHEGVEPGGAASEGVESGGAEPQGAASSGGSAGASLRLSPQQLREWFVWLTRLQSGASGAGGAGAAGSGGAHTQDTGAAVTGGVEGAGAGDLAESGATGAGAAGAGGAGVGGAGAGGPGLGGPCVGGAGAGGAGAVDPGAITLRPSSVPLRVPLPAPPDSSLLKVPDRARTASPTVSRLLAFAVNDPFFESAAASSLVAELLDVAAACCLDYTIALVAESASASPPSVGGECALGKDVLEDRQEYFECLTAVLPRFASMLLAPEGDPDAPDIPTPRSYAEAITNDYSSSVAARPAQHDYELHSLDFSTAFLQGSLHEEIWLRCPPGFTESFPAGTQWSLRRPVYGLRQAPRDWHDMLRTTLAALGFAPATAGPSVFLRTDTSLPPFYVLVYVDNLVFATADTEALTLLNSELQKRHTCIDLGEMRSYLGSHITRD